MKKNLFSRILFLSLLFVVTSMQSAIPRKPWTFLVYLAGANDLDVFIQENMDQMMAIGSNDRINILVYLSTHYAGQKKETKKLYVNKGSVTQHGPTTVRDSGNVETFKSALSWACTEFPSDHIAVVCWDHGLGALNKSESISGYKRGVCYDFDTGHYLTDRDLFSAFSWARDTLRRGRKIDIVAFDACLMASLEIAATLSSCANYMVASEDSMPGTGFDYYRMLNQFNTRTPDALTFAKRMVTAYQEVYVHETDYTLSAIDLQALSEFITNFSEVSEFLAAQLQSNKMAAKLVIKKSVGDLVCPVFNLVYIDVLQFYKNLLAHGAELKLSLSDTADFKALVANGIELFPYFVKANVVGRDYKQAGGLTVYFDARGVDTSYSRLFWTTEINGWWLNLLRAYVAR